MFSIIAARHFSYFFALFKKKYINIEEVIIARHESWYESLHFIGFLVLDLQTKNQKWKIKKSLSTVQ